jgi:hypothetical protein
MWYIERAKAGPVARLFYIVNADNHALFKLKNLNESLPTPKDLIGKHPSPQILSSRNNSGYFSSIKDTIRFCNNNRIRWRLNVAGELT